MGDGVGTVELRKMRLDLPEGGLKLAYGGVLPEVEVAYEMCGAHFDGTNAIYICHVLTGDAHVAGAKPGETKPSGWWEGMVGPGRAIDTRRWCVICANVLGGCSGTTGPMSINPATGRPYEPIEFEVSGDRIQAVHMLPGYTHNIINLSQTENLVTVMWANEIFDPERPDTFFEPV